jgi:hypothetical protein
MEVKEQKIIGEWISRKDVQELFNYGNTKMSSFASDYGIRQTRLGNRVFYNHKDIIELMDKRAT